jgi:hypothetical protein
MSLDLTDAELATAASACRAMAYQEGERAKKLQNPSMCGPIENTAKRFATLAEKLEAARKKKPWRRNARAPEGGPSSRRLLAVTPTTYRGRLTGTLSR